MCAVGDEPVTEQPGGGEAHGGTSSGWRGAGTLRGASQPRCGRLSPGQKARPEGLSGSRWPRHWAAVLTLPAHRPLRALLRPGLGGGEARTADRWAPREGPGPPLPAWPALLPSAPPACVRRGEGCPLGGRAVRRGRVRRADPIPGGSGLEGGTEPQGQCGVCCGLWGDNHTRLHVPSTEPFWLSCGSASSLRSPLQARSLALPGCWTSLGGATHRTWRLPPRTSPPGPLPHR